MDAQADGSAARVTGIGGWFVRSVDPAATMAFYREALGLDLDEYGAWRPEPGPTVLAAFPADTDYLGSLDQQAMVGFRVTDLEAVLARAREHGAEVVDDVQDLAGVGRFGWVHDPDGRRF